MGKGSKRQMKAAAKTHIKADARRQNDLDVDDDIDAFYKQRDVIPLDVDDKFDESEDEDLLEPVFNIGGSEEDVSDNAKSDDEEDEEDSGVNDNIKDRGFAAKIARQAKYLRQKFGTDDDDMDDHEEEQEEEKNAIWGRRKDLYYSADNVDYELQSSDEDLPMEEEAEVVKIQREKAQTLSMEDFGLQNVDQDKSDSDEQKNFQDAFAVKTKSCIDADNIFQNYEEIKKDLTALSKKEQMDVVYSSAPELVGLLSELNEALEQVGEVKPVLLKKVGERTGGMHFLEIKHVLLLSYCQAISYYLLLKSEGHPVRDHPVIARLVEIKNLLEKVKQIDTKNLPQEVEKNVNETTIANSENVLAGGSVAFEVKTDTMSHSLEPTRVDDFEKTNSSENAHKMNDNHNTKEVVQVGIQSLEMLKIRANLEAKLKKKGIYNQTKSNCEIIQIGALKTVDGHLRTLDYFDDEVQQTGLSHSKNLQSSSQMPKPPPLIKSKTKKSQVVSGDDDLPKRDDIGERRRRHELQVLARAGAVDDSDIMQDEDRDLGTRRMDANDSQESDGIEESEDEFYREVKKQKIEKLMAKAAKYTRTSAVPSAEPEADGKRHITYQMEKNRGLTRQRKKLNKNPRKKYRHKHEKQVKRRKGQVRDIRRPSGPYGGEATGINIRASHSVKFKN